MTQDPGQSAKKRLHNMTPTDVQAILKKRTCLLIDVREPGEYEAERIPDALLFPLSEFDASVIPFEGSRRIVFHCGSGKRSQTAAAQALATGVDEVWHMEGGIKAWKEAGLPIITFDPATGKPHEAAT